LLADADIFVGDVLMLLKLETAAAGRSEMRASVLRAEERLRDVGSLGARQLPVGQRVDRCLCAGAVGKRAKELDSLAWRQLKPTVPAWETQASDTARPVDVEAHSVSADSPQLTPQ
jgi:hypothetical protein